MDLLIEKKFLVTGHYLCTKYILGCSDCISSECAMGNKKLRPVIERYLHSTAIMLFGGTRSHLDNSFVLCGSIFFIHLPNKLYWHWLLADIKYVDLCINTVHISNDKMYCIEIWLWYVSTVTSISFSLLTTKKSNLMWGSTRVHYVKRNKCKQKCIFETIWWVRCNAVRDINFVNCICIYEFP